MNRHTPELDLAVDAARPKRRGRLLRAVIMVFVLGVGLWFGATWLHRRQTHIYVIDSRVASDMVTYSAEQEGRVTALDVGVGDRVVRGQRLVALDDRIQRLQVAETRADLQRVAADRERLAAERTLAEQRNAAAARSAAARTEVANAGERATTALYDRARAELDRGEALFQRRVISAQRLEELRTEFASADQQQQRARAAVKEAEAEKLVVAAESARLAVIDREIAVLDAQAMALESRLEQAQVTLDDRSVLSDIDGVVDQTFVEIGEFVRAGTRLLMVHNPDNVWVSANVKETELSRFEVGASVEIVVDAWPDAHFTGTVTWIGPAATSQFALLPTPNPSGNFTKVTQRVPVRIDIEGPKQLLRPGMMVEVDILARND
ncbi:MAG: HlyD family secretion protein [Pseudomonadota bacterium]|nr:HlyD family secretion protein [Pseudomonadota bacterium]